MHICKANTARETPISMTVDTNNYIYTGETEPKNTATTQTSRRVRALLKRPDKPPEIINIEFPFVMSSDESDLWKQIFPAVGAKIVYSCDYSSTIVMYYGGKNQPYNFNISYQSFYGNVLFLKCKRHHSLLTGTAPVSLSNIEIKRICAAMGWERPEEKG